METSEEYFEKKKRPFLDTNLPQKPIGENAAACYGPLSEKLSQPLELRPIAPKKSDPWVLKIRLKG